MYRVMKRIQEQQMAQAKAQQGFNQGQDPTQTNVRPNPKNVINADFKVVD